MRQAGQPPCIEQASGGRPRRAGDAKEIAVFKQCVGVGMVGRPGFHIRVQPAAVVIMNRHAEAPRSEEHTSELQSLMRISYAVFCLKKKKHTTSTTNTANTYKNKK